MQSYAHLYPLALIVPALFCGTMARYAWRRRATPAAAPFAVVMAAVAWWSLTYGGELATSNLHLQIFYTCLEYLGVVTIPVAWLVFCLQYAGAGDLATRERILALALLPALTLLALWTNHYHHLFYVSIAVVQTGWLRTWVAVHGPFYWINVTYSYSLILTGITLMLRTVLRSPRHHRPQSYAVILAVLFPWGANIYYMLGLGPVHGLDLTPYAFVVTGVVLAWGLFRMRLLDVLPIARDALFEAMRDGAVVIDEQERVLDANVMARRIFDQSQEALLGRQITEILPCWPALLAQSEAVEPSPFSWTQSAGLVAERIYELRLFPLGRTEGAPCSHLLLMRDVTAAEAARRALRDTEVSYRELFDTVNEAVYIHDVEGHFLAVNHGAERMYGYPREFFVGKTPEVLAAPGKNDMAQVAEHVRRAFAGQPQQFPFWGIRSNGEVFPKEVRLYKGRYLGQDVIIALALDVSERQRVEEAQRLAAVGQLAAGVAHEFNNLLAAMLLRAEMAADTDSPEARELVDVVMRSARRGGETCSNLMAFASPRQLQQAPVLMRVPLDHALVVAHRQIENTQVVLARVDEAPLARVHGDAGQLEQVFLNLIINACHAMSEPQVPPAARRLTIHTALAGDENHREVVVTVADTGVGIAPEYLPRVFEPFFTTRAGSPDSDKNGTGLGLSVSHGIIAAHCGRVEVSSTPGKGAAFTVRLPLHDLAPDEPLREEPSSEAAAQLPPARVLLAEDEGDVRDAVCRSLSADGHEVTPVGTTEAALAALEGNAFDALITDLMLPGEGGEAILRRACALDPRPATLVITGKLDPQLDAQLAAAGADMYLQKPFSLLSLRQALAELLQRTDPD